MEAGLTCRNAYGGRSDLGSYLAQAGGSYWGLPSASNSHMSMVSEHSEVGVLPPDGKIAQMLLTSVEADRGCMDGQSDGYKALLAAAMTCEAEHRRQAAGRRIAAHIAQASACDLQHEPRVSAKVQSIQMPESLLAQSIRVALPDLPALQSVDFEDCSQWICAQ